MSVDAFREVDGSADDSPSTDDEPFVDIEGSDDDATHSTTNGSETFVDMASSLRLERDDDLGFDGEDAYTSEDGDKRTDSVDPQKLWSSHTLDDIRYYAREGEFGGTIINKPVDDAFKHGYTVTNDYSNAVEDFLDDYESQYKPVEKKARRDGMALLLFQLRDGNNIEEEPTNVKEIADIQTITLDRLSDTVSRQDAMEAYDLELSQITVLDEGVVICDDLTHPLHGEVLGYGVEVKRETGQVNFVHADRCQHFVWNDEVDGDLDDDVFGDIVGDSVLTAPLASMKAIKKGNYAMGEALFRYSAPLHAAETPEDYGEEEFEMVDDQMHDLSMMSSAVLPPGVELNTHEGATDFDPTSFYDVLIQNICAATEFTKPVLMGTQTGTVSGSETDIKNYFNAVEEFRQNRARRKFREAVEMVHDWNQSIIPTFSLAYKIDWEPLFKLDRLDRSEAMRTAMNTASQAVNTYVMSPSEARKFIEREFVALESDVELDELTEEEWEELERVNLSQSGVEASENEGNPRVGNTNSEGEGGRSQGQNASSTNPTSQ